MTRVLCGFLNSGNGSGLNQCVLTNLSASTGESRVFSLAHSQALLGNVVLQAGACLVGSQSGDWELAHTKTNDKVLIQHMVNLSSHN